MDLKQMTAVELSAAIKDKKVTVREAVEVSLDAIAKKEESLNCYVTVDREGAL